MENGEPEQLKYEQFKRHFMRFIENQPNQFHPLARINGNPQIGENTFVGFFSEINAKGSSVIIGNNCDIASFVSINVADSHKKCLGLADEIERKPIYIEDSVFIGSHCFIGGGTKIRHHSVIGAGTILKNVEIPPYSLVTRDQKSLIIKEGYYQR